MFKPQSAREREEWKKFLEEDAKEQAAIAERIAAPLEIRELEQEMNQATRKLGQVRRQRALGYEENPYISPEVQAMRHAMSDEEINAFNKREAQEFVNETADWHPTPENIQTLIEYFTNRGIYLFDKAMLRAAYISLRRDGLFDEKPNLEPKSVAAPAPEKSREESFDHLERLPLGHQSPIAYKQEPDGSQEGWDLVTGERRVYSSYEIKLLSSDDYKRAFGVPTTYLSKGSFLR
jgi:hypothetical protein